MLVVAVAREKAFSMVGPFVSSHCPCRIDGAKRVKANKENMWESVFNRLICLIMQFHLTFRIKMFYRAKR